VAIECSSRARKRGVERNISKAESFLIRDQSPLCSPDVDAGAYISADDLKLYFASDRPSGFAARDIYVSMRKMRSN
jgi:hypothetical protein